MVIEQSQETIEARNERSLNTLLRAMTLAQNQFALILVRCNYTDLRDRIVKQLQERCSFPIHALTLPETAKTLYTTLQAEMKTWGEGAIEPEETNYPSIGELSTSTTLLMPSACPSVSPSVPKALMIFGLEALQSLDQVLIATNLVREELRKQFQFPLVLWGNDEVLRKFERLAPDLYSWAGNALIQFDMATPELVQSLTSHSDRLFHSILDSGDEQVSGNWAIAPKPTVLRQSELKFALDDLQASDYIISPELQASLDFLLGQDAHASGEMETAHELYERSLQFWLEEADSPYTRSPISYTERAACVLFYLGLWWRSYAVLQRATYRCACQQAYDYFRRSLLLFTEENRQNLVARFIIAEAETLQKLEEWDALEELAKQALVLHKLHRDPIRQARDHGFLAETALARSHWAIARQQVSIALEILERTEADLQEAGHPPDPHLEYSLELAHRYHYGWYLFLLARAEKELGNLDAAIRHLETARDFNHPQNDPPLYIQILRRLRGYYFKRGDYQLAFRTKQTRRLIEHQYGYRAFVGALRLQPQQLQPGVLFPLPPQIDQQTLLAQEIAASGRQKDLDQLLNRLSLPKDKLIVIHGPSGVGKSSIVTGGLIPMLQEHFIGERTAVPILLDVYTDWRSNLEQKLLAQIPDHQPSPDLLTSFQTLTERNFLPVLILDQFEEFFFVYDTIQSRRPFYHFLRDCLNLPFVKVILSLREDYLHYLLEFQRLTDLDIINNDILSKDIRYPLSDFTREEARTVIKSLTEQAQFYLPDNLIDALVDDLAGELGEVRPIELQVVGAQLQAEEITTLADYLKKGPKEKLVQRSLEDVVGDCGPENEELARLILFLLTNENGTRPLKTRDDLEADLIDLGLITQPKNLDLVLEVLVWSGLLFLIPEYPADLYQLVHDYLVSFIREQYKTGLVEELERERGERRTAERKSGLEFNYLKTQGQFPLMQRPLWWVAMGGLGVLGTALLWLNFRIK